MTRTPWITLPQPVRDRLTHQLSQRQLDVLILWLAGCSIERMATMLGLAPRTIRTHLHRANTVYHQELAHEQTPTQVP